MTGRVPVLLLSPFAGEVERNVAYARAAMADSIKNHNEAPFASHLLYPQILDDDDPLMREIGLACEHVWLPLANRVVVYIDFGISNGMTLAIDRATAEGLPKHMRRIS